MRQVGVTEIVAEAKRRAGAGAYALFDADGTLWAFDIANRLFEYLVRERALKREGLPSLQQALAASALSGEGDANQCFTRLLDAYDRGATDEHLTFATMTRALAGFTLTELNEAHARAMATPTPAQGEVFPEVRELFNELRAAGIRINVCSASPVWTVEFGLALCGLEADNVRAAETRVIDGRVSDCLIEPMTYREGKLEVALRDFGGPPLVGFGDSRGDVAFLAASQIAVCVNARPALRAAARDFTGQAFELRCPRSENGMLVKMPERDVVTDSPA